MNYMNKIPKFTDNGIEYIDADAFCKKVASINENRLYHFTSFENFVKIWLSKSLLFSKRERMNDVAEKEDMIKGNNPANMMAYLYAVREYSQISFSNAKIPPSNDEKMEIAIYQSPLMWGIYAKNATGVCIEFDKNKLLSKLSSGHVIGNNIRYIPYIPNNSLIESESTAIESIQSIDDARLIVEKHIDEIYFVKSAKWQFENEYRLISRDCSQLGIDGLITKIFIYNGNSNQEKMIYNLIQNQIEVKVVYLSTILSGQRYFDTYTLSSNIITFCNDDWRNMFEKMLIEDKRKKLNGTNR